MLAINEGFERLKLDSRLPIVWEDLRGLDEVSIMKLPCDIGTS